VTRPESTADSGDLFQKDTGSLIFSFLFQGLLQDRETLTSSRFPKFFFHPSGDGQRLFDGLPAPCATDRRHHRNDNLNKASFFQGNVLHRRRLRDLIFLLLPEIHAVLENSLGFNNGFFHGIG
jgi:hypothetical protein